MRAALDRIMGRVGLDRLIRYPLRSSLILIHFALGCAVFYAPAAPKHIGEATRLAYWMAGPYWWVTAVHWTVAAAILVGMTWTRLYDCAQAAFVASVAFFNALAIALAISVVDTSSNALSAILCAALSLISTSALQLPPPGKLVTEKFLQDFEQLRLLAVEKLKESR